MINQSCYFKKCTTHSKKNLDTVCLDDQCHKRGLICNFCLFNEHENHKHVPYETFLKSLKEGREQGYVKTGFRELKERNILQQNYIEEQVQQFQYKVENFIDQRRRLFDLCQENFENKLDFNISETELLVQSLTEQNDQVQDHNQLIQNLLPLIDWKMEKKSDGQKNFQVEFKQFVETKVWGEEQLQKSDNQIKQLQDILDKISQILGPETSQFMLKQTKSQQSQSLFQDQQTKKNQEFSQEYQIKSNMITPNKQQNYQNNENKVNQIYLESQLNNQFISNYQQRSQNELSRSPLGNKKGQFQNQKNFNLNEKKQPQKINSDPESEESKEDLEVRSQITIQTPQRSERGTAQKEQTTQKNKQIFSVSPQNQKQNQKQNILDQKEDVIQFSNYYEQSINKNFNQNSQKASPQRNQSAENKKQQQKFLEQSVNTRNFYQCMRQENDIDQFSLHSPSKRQNNFTSNNNSLIIQNYDTKIRENGNFLNKYQNLKIVFDCGIETNFNNPNELFNKMMGQIQQNIFENIIDLDFSNIQMDNHKINLVTQFLSIQPKTLNAIKIIFNNYSFDDTNFQKFTTSLASITHLQGLFIKFLTNRDSCVVYNFLKRACQTLKEIIYVNIYFEIQPESLQQVLYDFEQSLPHVQNLFVNNYKLKDPSKFNRQKENSLTTISQK